MLDLPRLQRIRLMPRPVGQIAFAVSVLIPNYHVIPGIEVEIEGMDRIPEEPVIFAMNHTDRYNYFPFMYTLWRKLGRYMTVWVKGKYYENTTVGMFMELTSNLPTVSRGYIITKDFSLTMGRRPTETEYDTLRARVNAEAEPDSDPASVDVSQIPDKLLHTKRNILGVPFDPARECYARGINNAFAEMMREFVKLNERSFEKGLDLLVFPQGTRSIRLPRGRIGMMEVALRYQKTIVPVGCNGCDLIYPGPLPIAKKGKVVYRVGHPIPYEELAEFHIDEPYEPFSAEAEHKHRESFQGAVDVVMNRINDLLDPRYQFSEDRTSTGVRGTSRFM